MTNRNFGVGNTHSTQKSVLGDICHLISPIVGQLRMIEHRKESLSGDDLSYYIERLSDALRRAREVEEERI